MENYICFTYLIFTNPCWILLIFNAIFCFLTGYLFQYFSAY